MSKAHERAVVLLAYLFMVLALGWPLPRLIGIMD